MSAFADRPMAFELRAGGTRAAARDATVRLRLRPTGDGWSLITPDGRIVYRGLGLRARRECLEFARDHGILAVFG